MSRLNTPQRISAGAIATVALAAFLPWVSILGFSVSGIRGDGVITLTAAVVGAILLVVMTGAGKPSRGLRVALLVPAVLVAVVALADMNAFAASGLYLTLLGGIAWVVGAIWDLSATTEAPRAAGLQPGQWYLASDGRYYCWPDPTPYDPTPYAGPPYGVPPG